MELTGGDRFLDGAHVTHDVRMGDSITISGDAPELRLFTSPWFRRNHSNMWPDRRDAMRHGDAKNEPAEDGLLGDRDWIIDGK